MDHSQGEIKPLWSGPPLRAPAGVTWVQFMRISQVHKGDCYDEDTRGYLVVERVSDDGSGNCCPCAGQAVRLGQTDRERTEGTGRERPEASAGRGPSVR